MYFRIGIIYCNLDNIFITSANHAKLFTTSKSLYLGFLVLL